MNCKKGDIAVVVRGIGLGKIVTCIELYDGPWINMLGQTIEKGKVFGWITDSVFFPEIPGLLRTVKLDEMMKPIRDQPGEDETLQWAPIPEKKELSKIE